MNPTRFRFLTLALALAVAAPLAVQAHGGQEGAHKSQRFGEHGREHGRHGGKDFTRRLDLSDTQRDKIFELRHAAEPALRTKGKEVRTARHEARKLAMTENFDEKRALALSSRAAQAEAEYSVMRLRLTNQIYNVLTPEQRQKAVEGRTQRVERDKAEAEAAPAV